MFLKKLELHSFRNYKNCSLEFSSNKIILVGKNAQGKTNLLESIYYTSVLNTPRAKSDTELVKMGEELARIKLEVDKFGVDISLEVNISPPKHKVLKVNGLKKTKYSEFLGNLITVNFSVNDLLLLRGSPSDRRGWIDDSISQIYLAYKDRLVKYNKIRTQRNNYLKEFKGNINLNPSQQAMLDVWNDQLTTSGSNLIHLRQKFLKEVQPIANSKHQNITNGEESLLVIYNSTITDDYDSEKDEILKPDEIKEIFETKLKDRQNEEIIRAQTVIGPHRDDIYFQINGIDAKSFASQGQQRTIVLSLKLAEMDFIRDIIKENPILLLDDVLAELDSSRQNYLLNSIGKEVQTIITTVDISSFKEDYLKDVTIYKVEQGQISEQT